MIRILYSQGRTSEEYLMLSKILSAGLQHFCTNNCKSCEARKVCKSVDSAATYALILAGEQVN